MKTSWIALLGGLLLVALAAGCRPAPDEPTTPQPIRVSTDNSVLIGRVAGSPQADSLLIALHGGPGNTSDYLLELEQLESESLAVLTYDQRGSGQSLGPTVGYSMQEHVADLEAVVEWTGRERVILLGHSWGGVLALRYASLHPEQVAALILVGSGPPSSAAVAAGQANLVERMAALREQGILPAELPECEKEQARAILPAYFSDPTWELPAVLDQLAYTPHVYRRTMEETGEWDFAAELQGLDRPVLFLWGADDPFGWEMAQATLDALPAAEVETVVLEACGHYWQECSEPFYAAVRDFLHGHEMD